MSMLLWVLSFFYLAGVAGWVTVALREEDRGANGTEDESPPSVLARTLSFAAMVTVGTLAFALLVFLIELMT
ncbi:hypothetical protein ACFL59_06005 [Planctomycetota bacterium]